MAENGAWPGVLLEDEVEVRTANATSGDLDEQFSRSRVGDRHVLDRQSTVTDIDSRRHQVLSHRIDGMAGPFRLRRRDLRVPKVSSGLSVAPG